MKNTITALKDASATWHTNSEDITNIVTQYFGELFTTSYPSDMKDVLECIQPRVMAEMNASLYKPYMREEVNRVLA